MDHGVVAPADPSRLYWFSEPQWQQIEAVFPRPNGKKGFAQEVPNRQACEAVLFRARTGCPWRDLPAVYGPWHTIYMRWRRWVDAGVPERAAQAILAARQTAGDFDPENPGASRAVAYDVVWNGQELGGGSIRIHSAEVQEQVFAALGIDKETAEARFGFLLEALRYGAPPHGGIAYGIDRFVQRLAGAETIRDVIAFPKTASGFDLLTGAPAPVDELQLREVGVAIHKRGKAGH